MCDALRTQIMYSHLIIYDHCLSISDFLGKDDLDLHVELAHDSNDIQGKQRETNPKFTSFWTFNYVRNKAYSYLTIV